VLPVLLPNFSFCGGGSSPFPVWSLHFSAPPLFVFAPERRMSVGAFWFDIGTNEEKSGLIFHNPDSFR
jgi:hypothetical protein